MSKTTMIKTDLEIKGPRFFFQTQNLSKSEHIVDLTWEIQKPCLFPAYTEKWDHIPAQTHGMNATYICVQLPSECLITSWANNVIFSSLQDYFSIQRTLWKKSWQRAKVTTCESSDTLPHQRSALPDWMGESSPFSFIQNSELLKSIFSLPQKRSFRLSETKGGCQELTHRITNALTVSLPQKSTKLFAVLQLKFRDSSDLTQWVFRCWCLKKQKKY